MDVQLAEYFGFYSIRTTKRYSSAGDYILCDRPRAQKRRVVHHYQYIPSEKHRSHRECCSTATYRVPSVESKNKATANNPKPFENAFRRGTFDALTDGNARASTLHGTCHIGGCQSVLQAPLAFFAPACAAKIANTPDPDPTSST